MNSELRQALQEGEKLGMRYAMQFPQFATSGWAGSRTGNRAGSSMDFQDFREYEPGDDLRLIDWSIYARTDRLTVKLFREEVIPHLDLIIDGSRSMALADTQKAIATAEIAAALATAAENAHCTHAAWLSGEGFQRLPNDSHAPSAWDRLAFDSERTPDQSLEIMPPKFRRLGVRVLISDLLWPGEPMKIIRRLQDGAAALFVIQLLAREDVTPPEHGNLRIVDSETNAESELYIDASLVKQYSTNLARLQQSWSDACRQSGVHMTTLIAEDWRNSISELEKIQLLAPA